MKVNKCVGTNDLQKKTLTKYELQEMMDSMEAKLDTKIDGLKGEIMEGFVDVWTTLGRHSLKIIINNIIIIDY
jgi:hypothetical protein